MTLSREQELEQHPDRNTCPCGQVHNNDEEYCDEHHECPHCEGDGDGCDLCWSEGYV